MSEIKKTHKIRNFFLYLFGIFVFLFSVGIIFSNIISGIILLLISISLIPKNYEKIKEKFKNTKLFGLKYGILAFTIFIFSFSYYTQNEVNKNENIKKSMILEVKSDISDKITTKDKIRLIIKKDNIEKITINGKEIKSNEKVFNLKLGINKFKIIGYNGNLEKKIEKTIEKIREKNKRRKEEKEKEKRIKLEEEKNKKLKIKQEIEKQLYYIKTRLEEKEIELFKKLYVDTPKKYKSEEIQKEIKKNNLIIEKYKKNQDNKKSITELIKLNEKFKNIYGSFSNKINEKLNSKWFYNNSTDEMDGTVTKYAILNSNNTVKLDWPYGEQKAILTVRKTGYKTDILFSIGKGQINSYNKTARLKFDDEKPIYVRLTGTSDGSSNTVFLGSTNLILKKLKYSKILKIELEYYSNGKHISSFDVKGFDL